MAATLTFDDAVDDDAGLLGSGRREAIGRYDEESDFGCYNESDTSGHQRHRSTACDECPGCTPKRIEVARSAAP